MGIFENDTICVVFPPKNDEMKKIQFKMYGIDLAYKLFFR